jgi:hypothetical protein
VGAVAGFAQEDHARITDEIEQRIVIPLAPGDGVSGVPNRVGQGGRCGARHDYLRGAVSGARLARANSSRTSSSVVCEKSSYQLPTATNGSGTVAQTTSSA